MKLAIGQVLYYVPHDARRGPPFEVSVGAIGRKWASLFHVEAIDPGCWNSTMAGRHYGRCDFNGDVDGGGYTSPGRCWASKADYIEQESRRLAWLDFVRMVRDTPYTAPPGVSRETINYVSGLLGLTTVYPSEGTP
jgi:hypothetical protein